MAQVRKSAYNSMLTRCPILCWSDHTTRVVKHHCRDQVSHACPLYTHRLIRAAPRTRAPFSLGHQVLNQINIGYLCTRLHAFADCSAHPTSSTVYLSLLSLFRSLPRKHVSSCSIWTCFVGKLDKAADRRLLSKGSRD
jgi:hypothetical protein